MQSSTPNVSRGQRVATLALVFGLCAVALSPFAGSLATRAHAQSMMAPHASGLGAFTITLKGAGGPRLFGAQSVATGEFTSTPTDTPTDTPVNTATPTDTPVPMPVTPISVDQGADYASGANPPHVGQSTVFTYTITVQNNTSHVLNLSHTVHINLGANVDGTVDSTSQGSASVSNGAITWGSSSNAFTLDAGQSATLVASLTFTPVSSDEGQVVDLTTSVTVTAFDQTTGHNLPSAGLGSIPTSAAGGVAGGGKVGPTPPLPTTGMPVGIIDILGVAMVIVALGALARRASRRRFLQ